MSIGTVSPTRPIRAWPVEIQERWLAASARLQLRVRVGLLVAVTAIAFHYSLSSLLQTINYDTPLAYVALVPLIAGALAWAVGRQPELGPDIRDRQLDYIIGVPLVVLALAMNEYLPQSQSVLFWVRRMDLVALPIFVAGAVTLIFGTRTLWRQKAAVVYLFLAWPWPYQTLLAGPLNSFTNLTISMLKACLSVVHLGKPLADFNGETGLFAITHNGTTFPVSVVTACSGVDGMVGFLLVGTAFAVIVRGPTMRKTLWLLTGMGLLWFTNLGRLLLIFWAGKLWGEQVAINVLHPIAGLVIFNIGIVLMLLLLKPFGLRIGTRQIAGPGRGAGTPGTGGVRSHSAQPIFMVAGIVAAVSVLLGINNESLKSFDPVASASGDPRLESFLVKPAAPVGWSPYFTTEYFQNRSLFGESSRWFRYTYEYQHGGDLQSSAPVTADVINAGGVSGFGAYGVEACYNFHGYTLRDVARVSLGDGISGQALSFSTQTGADWSIVYWIWPVKTGTQTRYERIILYLANTSVGEVKISTPVPGVSGLQGALSDQSAVDNRLIVNRAFLVAFAREVIKAQSKIVETSANIDQVTAPTQGATQASIDTSGITPADVQSGSGSEVVQSPSTKLHVKSTQAQWVAKLRALEQARRDAAKG